MALSQNPASATRYSPACIRNTGGTNCAAPKTRLSMDIYHLYTPNTLLKTKSLYARAPTFHMLDETRKSAKGLGAGGVKRPLRKLAVGGGGYESQNKKYGCKPVHDIHGNRIDG